MFTGIIQALGYIQDQTETAGGMRLSIEVPQGYLDGVVIGDSIAINGVCLTATSFSGNTFTVDVSNETLRCTSLGQTNPGDSINLEKALQVGAHLGGHMVSGHVDGLGHVAALEADGDSLKVDVKVPDNLAKYIAAKGSVTVDGVSLTVNTVDDSVFSVNLIPHTQTSTTFSGLKMGQSVNIEVDLIARYLERLISHK